MKKSFFLIIPAMAILMASCTASLDSQFIAPDNRHARFNSDAPVTLDRHGDAGLHLILSPRSSLNIDVEGILDYVQGSESFGPEYDREDRLDPWIRLNLSF